MEDDTVKPGEKDVMVVSDSDKIREMDNRGEYEKIYEEEGFVSVYKCGRWKNVVTDEKVMNEKKYVIPPGPPNSQQKEKISIKKIKKTLEI